MRTRCSEDPKTSLRRLYRGLNAFDVTRAEESIVVQRLSSPLYGEIMPTAAEHLFDYLQLDSKDVLFDLGSGAGKFVMHAAMTNKMRRCVGIELVKPRHRISEFVLSEAKAAGLLRTEDVEFQCWDFMRAKLAHATVIYTCSTAFPAELMIRLTRRLARLPSGTRFVSLQDIDDNPWFELQHVLRLDMTWARRRRVHVYRRR